jgi:acetolactate decarboxylase
LKLPQDQTTFLYIHYFSKQKEAMSSIFFTQTIKNGNNSKNLIRNLSSGSYFYREGMLIAASQRTAFGYNLKAVDSTAAKVLGSPAKVIEAEYPCALLPDNPLEATDFSAHVKADGVELIGPSHASTSNVETAKDFLYQYAAVSTFKAGRYDGNLTLGELKKRGDFGLGTFNGVDGELVANQGKFYRVHSSGTVSEVSDCDHTSLAFVKFFKVDLSFTVQNADITLKQLQKKIESLLTVDKLYAIRIKGTFSKLTARASALAQKPYQPLEEHFAQNQVIFNLSNTTGVAVGFLVPNSLEKVNIPGFHFHYIADDLQSGGHVFDFTANQVTVEIDKTKGCYLELNTMAIPEK